MDPRPEYTATLDRLAALLKKKPLTAKAIAKAMDCCIPAAHGRLAALRERGDALYTMPVRESPVGPLSTAYGLR